jgi:hypothetical protein
MKKNARENRMEGTQVHREAKKGLHTGQKGERQAHSGRTNRKIFEREKMGGA